MAGVSEPQPARESKRLRIAGVTSGHDAVEHVYAAHDRGKYVTGFANTHQVSGLMCGELVMHTIQNSAHRLVPLAHGEPAYGVSGQVELYYLGGAAFSQIGEHPALLNGEKRLGQSHVRASIE